MTVWGFVLTNERLRNITTYHAEDGSGVGSAIIAGLLLFLSWILPDVLIFLLHTAMTKKRKDAGVYPDLWNNYDEISNFLTPSHISLLLHRY